MGETIMKHLLSIGSAFALILLAGTATGQTWCLVPTEGVNIHPEYANVTTVLLGQHLSEGGILVLSAEEGEEIPGDLYKRGAEACVFVTAVRMGERVKVSAQLKEPSGTIRFAVSLVAANPDDLDSVAARVARALITGEAPREGETIYDVTEDEQDKLKRKKSHMNWGFKILGATHFTSALSRQPVKPGFGGYILYDPRFFLAEISTDFVFGSKGDYSEFSWNIGVSGYYPLSQSNIAPYVGGGVFLSTRSASWEDKTTVGETIDTEKRGFDTDYGISLHAAVGVLLGRTSDVNLRADLRFFVDTFKVDDEFSCGLIYSIGVGF